MEERIFEMLRCAERHDDESRHLARLVATVLDRPAPPGAAEHFPDYGRLQLRLGEAIGHGDGDHVEEAFLELYAHVHMHEAPYTASERRRMDATGGYWCHAGGLSPILKAAPHIGPQTVSADLGAGNGLQGLLLQVLYPHATTIQLEISGEMVEIGRSLQRWLGVGDGRVRWVVGDVIDFSPTGIDFLYLYRPVKPVGPGHDFYTRLAREIEAGDRPTTIFSIADCLRDYLSEQFQVFYCDGQLTCFKRR